VTNLGHWRQKADTKWSDTRSSSGFAVDAEKVKCSWLASGRASSP